MRFHKAHRVNRISKNADVEQDEPGELGCQTCGAGTLQTRHFAANLAKIRYMLGRDGRVRRFIEKPFFTLALLGAAHEAPSASLVQTATELKPEP